MSIDDVYEELRAILQAHQVSEEESQEMIDYLEENASESELPEDEYIESLGGTDQIAQDFLAEAERLKQYRKEQLPPLPGQADQSEKPEKKAEAKPEATPDPSIREEDLDWKITTFNEDLYDTGPDAREEEPDAREEEPDAREEEPDVRENPAKDAIQSFSEAASDFFEQMKKTGHLFTDEPSYDESRATCYSIPPQGFAQIRDIRISLTNGFCRIKTGEKTGVTVLEGQKYVSVSIKKDKIQIEQNPAAFLPFLKDRKGTVEIVVPKGTVLRKIRADSVNVSIDVKDVEAQKVHLETVNGSLKLDHICAEKISLSSVNGVMECTHCDYDKLSVDNVNGKVYLYTPDDFRLDIETVSGKIQVEDPFGRYIHKDVVGTTLKYNPIHLGKSAAGKVHVSNVAGEIYLFNEGV